MDRPPDAGVAPPPRPLPDRPLRERAAEWIAWFGLPRLAATAVCMLVVAGGAWWLVRSPALPPEATLPRATAAT